MIIRIDGGKVRSADSAASEASPARATARRIFAGVIAALEACERELEKVEAEARAKADKIIADAQRLSDTVKVKSDGFYDAMAKAKAEIYGDKLD